jgi:hypothetical protein
MSRIRIRIFVFAVLAGGLSSPALATYGDYNDNGSVDAADYVVYRKNLDTVNWMPNDATPYWVMPDDHQVWRANYSPLTGSGLGVSTVPEPSAIALIAAFAAVYFVRRRR